MRLFEAFRYVSALSKTPSSRIFPFGSGAIWRIPGKNPSWKPRNAISVSTRSKPRIPRNCWRGFGRKIDQRSLVGWKTQTILIRPAFLDGGPDKLLADLGYEERRKINETSFSYAGRGSIWIGSIEDCIVIYTHFAGAFFDENAAKSKDFIEFKNALLRRFPEADVAAFSAHSVVGHWGFAIFRRGALIRRQYGADGITFCDEGSRLPVEEAYIAKFQRIETEGEARYRDPDHPEYDDMTEADLGELLVPEICYSYTGVPLDALDAPGTNFWLIDDEAKFQASMQHYRPKFQSRPWWKFWG